MKIDLRCRIRHDGIHVNTKSTAIVSGNVIQPRLTEDINQGVGIRVSGDPLYVSIRENRLDHLGNTAIGIQGDASATITHNHFDGYLYYAINNESGEQIDARGNWWGSGQAHADLQNADHPANLSMIYDTYDIAQAGLVN